jgi:hypothetical protein
MGIENDHAPVTVLAMQVFSALMSSPRASDMLREYRMFRAVGGLPCGQNISNQCAVRMSVALMNCDIRFHFDESKIKYMHSGNHNACGEFFRHAKAVRGHPVPHNTGAKRLFDYLNTLWRFERFPKRGSGARTPEQIRDAIADRPGIVFFEDCFPRDDGTNGDHIDYWDGSHVMNDRLSYNAPEERDPSDTRSSARWFRNSERQVCFFPVVNI